MKNYNQINQAILIRDIISMYREYSSDSNILEYLSSFVFPISEIVEENKIGYKNLNWDELFSFLDQKYHNLQNNLKTEVDESKINKLYDNAEAFIKENVSSNN